MTSGIGIQSEDLGPLDVFAAGLLHKLDRSPKKVEGLSGVGGDHRRHRKLAASRVPEEQG